jgi:hypothetical protein
VDDGSIEKIALMKCQYRACKNDIKAAVRLLLSKCAIDARVVDFWAAVLIFFDRQFFPLTHQVKQLQNVVEDFQSISPQISEYIGFRTNSLNYKNPQPVGLLSTMTAVKQ